MDRPRCTVDLLEVYVQVAKPAQRLHLPKSDSDLTVSGLRGVSQMRVGRHGGLQVQVCHGGWPSANSLFRWRVAAATGPGPCEVSGALQRHPAHLLWSPEGPKGSARELFGGTRNLARAGASRNGHPPTTSGPAEGQPTTCKEISSHITHGPTQVPDEPTPTENVKSRPAGLQPNFCWVFPELLMVLSPRCAAPVRCQAVPPTSTMA